MKRKRKRSYPSIKELSKISNNGKKIKTSSINAEAYKKRGSRCLTV